MNLRECYNHLGGDFDDVLGRLRREQTVEKFIFRFLEDESFSQLEESIAGRNNEVAFRAAHTLKGICQNLSFTKLYNSSADLTEALRVCDGQRAAGLLIRVSDDYHQTVNAVREYKELQEKMHFIDKDET